MVHCVFLTVQRKSSRYMIWQNWSDQICSSLVCLLFTADKIQQSLLLGVIERVPHMVHFYEPRKRSMTQKSVNIIWAVLHPQSIQIQLLSPFVTFFSLIEKGFKKRVSVVVHERQILCLWVDSLLCVSSSVICNSSVGCLLSSYVSWMC